jgi:alkylation response protein AidB-like acyl-CoA dehydrogenase
MSLVIPIETGELERVTAPSRLPKKIAERLAADFAQTAIERDRKGGTAKRERDLLRQSGLLNLLIPEELGGNGSDWPGILSIVRAFARVDGSLAHLFGFQHLLLATIELFGSDEQHNFYFKETVRHRWFWGNALNPLDRNTQIVQTGNQYRINGRKGFCSGATDSDHLHDPVDYKIRELGNWALNRKIPQATFYS